MLARVRVAPQTRQELVSSNAGLFDEGGRHASAVPCGLIIAVIGHCVTCGDQGAALYRVSKAKTCARGHAGEPEQWPKRWPLRGRREALRR